MIADTSQMSYIHDFMPFLSPQRVCSRAGTGATVRIKRHVVFTQRKNYTEKILHTEAFTQRGIYTEQLLHRRFCTQALLHTEGFYTDKPFLKKPYHMKPLHRAALHTDAFSHRSFLHTGTLTRRCPSFYTQELLHTHTPYKKKLLDLDTETFTAFSQESFYTEAFAQRCLYKQKLLHTEAFSQRSL